MNRNVFITFFHSSSTVLLLVISTSTTKTDYYLNNKSPRTIMTNKLSLFVFSSFFALIMIIMYTTTTTDAFITLRSEEDILASVYKSIQGRKSASSAQPQPQEEHHLHLPPSVSSDTNCSIAAIEEYYTELFEFIKLNTTSERCAVWPQYAPNFQKLWKCSGPSNSGTKEFNLTFSVYYTVCKTVDNVQCWKISESLSNRHQCYAQKVNTSGKCGSIDNDCMPAFNGKSCIPRMNQDFLDVYCTSCYAELRQGLLTFYNEMKNLPPGSSSSSSWSSSSSGSGGGNSVQVPDFGIIFSEAGFAAVDARYNLLCNNNNKLKNSFGGDDDENDSSCSNLYSSLKLHVSSFGDSLSHYLFDYDAGSPSYFTASSASNTTSLSLLSSLVCNSDKKQLGLSCFRRFINTWLNSNKALTSMIKQKCEEGRSGHATIECDRIEENINARLRFWSTAQASSFESLCTNQVQNEKSGSTSCLAAPTTSLTLDSCMLPAFSQGQMNLSTACYDDVTQVFFDKFDCCMQTLIDVNSPNLQVSLADYVLNEKNNRVSRNCTSSSNTNAPLYKKYVGIEFKNLPYDKLNGNKTLSDQLKTAIVNDLVSVIGIFSEDIIVEEFMKVDLSSSLSENDAAFYSSSSSVSSSSSSSASTGAVVILQTRLVDETAMINNRFQSWASSSSPSSPEIDVTLTTAGYGSQDVGTSSVAGSFSPPTPPPTPGAPTFAPGSPTPAPTPSPPSNNNNGPSSPSSNKQTIYIAVGVVAGLLLLVGVGLIIRWRRKKSQAYDGDYTETGSYQEIKTHKSEYGEVQ